jgi:tRNA nucleotidyltransferase (CCA-adding enzyme)
MEAKELFKKVEEIVSPVYMVGGSVRDQILGKEPYDFDFTTPLAPFAVEEKIRAAGKHVYGIGNRFGTIGMKIDGTMVEITTFRTEQYTNGSRKPLVEYVSSLEEDLKRRDFTINALAMKPDGEIIDLFGGREDLDRKLIRCVGNPKERFKEDPLRMLRAARFASQLDFFIDTELFDDAKKMAYKILEVSKERWRMEMEKLLVSDHPRRGLEFLWNAELFNYMIPELSLQLNFDQGNPHHTHYLHEHTIRVVENTSPDIYERSSALLHDVAKPFVVMFKNGICHYYRHELLGADMVDKIGRHLKWPNEMIDIVSEMVGEHMKEGSVLYEADQQAK